MNRPLLLALIFVLAMSAAAQPRRRPAAQQATPPQTSRKLVETVKTRDGREIRLYDDMTYEVVRATATSRGASNVTLNIKAGVITNAGDVKPVVRRDFYVFKEDIKSLLATATDREGKPLEVFSFALADEYRELDGARAFNGALDKLKPITVATFTTDFQGNGTVELPGGEATYWIYGSTQMVSRSFCDWYMEVTPSKSANLVFDNNNASYCARLESQRRHRTTRWTGAAGACFASGMVQRRLNEIAPPGQLWRWAANPLPSMHRC